MPRKKIISNHERHFSEERVVERYINYIKRKEVRPGTLLNWTVPHKLSRYGRPLFWIRQGETYYEAVDRVFEEWLAKKERQYDKLF